MNTKRQNTKITCVQTAAGVSTELHFTFAQIKLRSCIFCANFVDKTEGCLLADGQRPPARVIVQGCDSYDEEIPF